MTPKCFKFVLAGLIAPLMYAATCDSLASLQLPNTTIAAAQVVAAGEFRPPIAQGAKGKGANLYKDVPEFCRVSATLKPSADSDIKVEFWLPTSGWNRKLQVVGNGGWAGVISYSAMAEALRAHYASASTDTGHVGGSGSFAHASGSDIGISGVIDRETLTLTVHVHGQIEV